MKKIWMIGGLLIAGLMAVGFFIDKLVQKDNLFIIMGFGLGLIFMALLIFIKHKD
ncbi:hypothetical protein [Psychroflexus sp. MBR-150]|jgi:hypothetical protein